MRLPHSSQTSSDSSSAIVTSARSFGKLLLEKGNKLVCMDEQCGYVKNKPTEEK